MKLYISLARNIQNTDDFGNFVEKLSTDQTILVWLRSVFRKWLLANGPAVQITEVSAESPPWAKEAAAKGDLYQIDYDAAENLIRPIIDYFKFLQTSGKKFERMSYDEANNQQIAWHTELAARAGSSVLQEDGIAVVKMYPDGYSWVKVFGETSLNREGEIMGHCVGSYFDQVSAGESFVYSLRDKKNVPHVTIEQTVAASSIDQIKGTANTKIVKKYQPYVLDFLSLQPFNHINLDESGLKKTDVAKVVIPTPGVKEKLSFKGIAFNYIAPARPTFGFRPKLERVQTIKSPKLEMYDNLIPLSEDMQKYADELCALLEYCQQRELCGFSLYKRPFGNIPPQYSKISMGLTSYTQNIGSSKFVFGHKPGAFWSLRLDDYQKANLLICNAKGTPVALLAVNKDKVDVLNVMKIDMAVFADLRTWLGDRPLHFLVMRFNAKLRALETFFAPPEEPKVKGAKSSTKPISYVEVEKNTLLVEAFKFFGRGMWQQGAAEFKTMKTHAMHLDALDSIDQVKAYYKKNKIPASGYLYMYFPAFLILLLMKNKRLAFEYVASSTALAKQFDAFTCSPTSILSGAFARTPDIQPNYKEISKHMKSMLPIFDDILDESDNKVAVTKIQKIQKRFYSK